MGAGHALVVDDRLESRAIVVEALEAAGFRVTSASDGVEGWRAFRDHAPDLVVTDLRMPRTDGLELVGRLRRESDVPVVVLSAFADVPAAVAALKAGADEFLRFPDDLQTLVGRAKRLAAARRSRRAAGPALGRRVVGRSPAMRRVRERIEALAPLRVPVWVWGEAGTGRDCVVEALHALGPLAGAPLVRVGPGQPPADAGPPGAGDPHSLYLDGLDTFPLEEQVRWARSLAAALAPGGGGARARAGGRGSGEPLAPGLASPRAKEGIAPRVLVSSVEDPAALLRDGRVRPELVDLLSRFSVWLPPLRQRPEDVPLLVNALLARIGPALGRESCRVASGAAARLKARSWPGNVRELAGVLEKLVAFSAGGVIRAAQVDAVLSENPESVASLRMRRQLAQRRELVMLLDECGGNLAEVARRLQLSRGAVIYRARRFGLLDPPSRAGEP